MTSIEESEAPSHSMTYSEREKLKSFASEGKCEQTGFAFWFNSFVHRTLCDESQGFQWEIEIKYFEKTEFER